MIVFFLFYSYAFDVKTCQAKLDLTADILRPTTTHAPIKSEANNLKLDQHSTFYTITLLNAHLNKTDLTARPMPQDQCGHIITTYVLPSLLHLISYLMGFIYFRINENEQLYALMEKVFLAVNVTLKTVSQDRVIKRLK